jgi:outer membrane protein assembly factor BamC
MQIAGRFNSDFGILCAVVAAVLLAGCSTMSIESKRIDYRSASRAPALEIPPDLSAPVYDERYRAITASGQAAGTPGTAAAPGTPGTPLAGPGAKTASTVLPETANAHIERAGNERWLVVDTTPDNAWKVTREFWTQHGFNIDVERPELGIMETDWAENRAKLPQDVITRTLSNVLGSLYSTNTLDRYRTRIERAPDGKGVEIYVSHRGMEEVARGMSGGSPTGFVWQPRPIEPELEAEFLRRLMVKFGTPEPAAIEAVAQSGSPAERRARLERGSDGASQLVVDDPFDRAWRRVGLALDRSGFTVVDRDRSKGVYFVRFSDPEGPSGAKRETGWLSKLMFWRTEDAKQPEQYRVVVSELPSTSVVMVQNTAGSPERSQTAERILTLLEQQLR